MGAVTKDHHSKFKQLYQQGLALSSTHSVFTSHHLWLEVLMTIDAQRSGKSQQLFSNRSQMEALMEQVAALTELLP